MKNLPDRWRSPKRARTKAKEAWWYGEKAGVYVVIDPGKVGGIAPLLGCFIPRRTLLEWADDVRKLKRR